VFLLRHAAGRGGSGTGLRGIASLKQLGYNSPDEKLNSL
jgi:hypothetical protein